MELRQELVSQLTNQAGISQQEAHSSIDTVLGQLRQTDPQADALLGSIGGQQSNAPAQLALSPQRPPADNANMLTSLLGQQLNFGQQKSSLVTSLIMGFLMSRLPQLGGVLGGLLGGGGSSNPLAGIFGGGQPQLQQQPQSNNPLDRNRDGRVGLDDIFGGSNDQPQQYQQPYQQQPQSNNPLDRNRDGRVGLDDIFGGSNDQPQQYQQPYQQQPQSNNPLDRNRDGRVGLDDIFGGSNDQPQQYQQPYQQQPQSNNPLDRNRDGRVGLDDIFGGQPEDRQANDEANRNRSR